MPPANLCNKHLLGEHNELHSMWNVITQGRKGYSIHPETLRWKGKLRAMYKMHDEIAEEMTRRGFNHRRRFGAIKVTAPSLFLYVIILRCDEMLGIHEMRTRKGRGQGR